MSLDDSPSIGPPDPAARADLALAMFDALPTLAAHVDRRGRYLFVNHAFEAWFGCDRRQIEGRPVAAVIGEAAYARLKRYADQALAGQTVTFEGQLADPLAGFSHVEARFVPQAPVDGVVPGYYMLVSDTAARHTGEQDMARLLHQERRRGALLDLGRQLREETDPLSVVHRACEVMAHQLSAPRAGFAKVDAGGELALIVGEWAAEGFASLAGATRRLDAFGPQISSDLHAGRPLVISDVTAGDATPQVLEVYGALRIGSYLTSPLVKGQRMAAYLYVCQDEARVWTPDEIIFVADIAELIWTASERARSEVALKQAAETERLLIREVDHRAKNVLAVVQSLANLTPFVDKAQYVEALSGRIGSLARSHSLLSTSRWIGVQLDALLRQELEPYGAGTDERLILEGPPVLIDAQAAQSLGLVLHELATNASKYGALFDVTGTLTVTWTWDVDLALVLEWRETSGRLVLPPTRQGFGSTLITQATRQLGARIERDWRPEGLTCRLQIARGAVPCKVPPAVALHGLTGHGSDEQAPLDRPLHDQRVLIVEDEALVAMELARVLTAAGAQVVGPAGSIEEALELVNRKPIDRAVLDINLGGRLVTPVAQALAARAIPFIYLTGYQEPGVSDGVVVRKPASAELLLGALAGRA